MNMNTKNRQRHTEESFTFALERSLLYAKRAKKNKWISLLKQTIQTKGEEWEITWAVLWWYFQNYGCAFWKRMCFFSDHAFCTNMVVVSSESEGWFCLLLYSFQKKRWEWAILAWTGCRALVRLRLGCQLTSSSLTSLSSHFWLGLKFRMDHGCQPFLLFLFPFSIRGA